MADDRRLPARPPSALRASPPRTAQLWPASASAQLNALLDDPRAPALVKEMPSVQLHRLVTQVGKQDSAELLALARPEQIRELLDLELWAGDRLLVDEALDWLQVLIALPSPVRRRSIRGLDVELVGAVLLRRARVHLIEDPDSDWIPEEGRPLLRTPDGWFLLEVLTEEPGEQEQLRELVNQLYVDEPEATRGLLHNLVGEQPDELEEMSYRWRNGRLQDLGFADPEEALGVYAYLDPRSVSPSEGTADRPLRSDPESQGSTDLVQILPAADSFWHRGVALVEQEEERRRIAAALLAVSNRAMAADRVHPADLPGARESLEGLHARLSVGLEHLAGGDPARAPAVLAGVALLRIARVGHSLALDVRRRLQAPLRGSLLGSAPGKIDRLDPPLSLQIGALLGGRPGRYVLEDRRAHPFHSLAQLAEAESWIARARVAGELADRQGPARPWPAGLTFGDLYRTAVANRLLSREGPLDGAAVARLVREQLRSGELERALPALVEAAGEPIPRDLAAEWLRELDARLRRLDPEHLDLRLVSGLWLEPG
jgi:hypothetical protein